MSEHIGFNRVDTPPILVWRDDVWYVRIVVSTTEVYEAPIGKHFIREMFEKVVVPKF